MNFPTQLDGLPVTKIDGVEYLDKKAVVKLHEAFITEKIARMKKAYPDQKYLLFGPISRTPEGYMAQGKLTGIDTCIDILKY